MKIKVTTYCFEAEVKSIEDAVAFAVGIKRGDAPQQYEYHVCQTCSDHGAEQAPALGTTSKVESCAAESAKTAEQATPAQRVLGAEQAPASTAKISHGDAASAQIKGDGAYTSSQSTHAHASTQAIPPDVESQSSAGIAQTGKGGYVRAEEATKNEECEEESKETGGETYGCDPIPVKDEGQVEKPQAFGAEREETGFHQPGAQRNSFAVTADHSTIQPNLLTTAQSCSSDPTGRLWHTADDMIAETDEWYIGEKGVDAEVQTCAQATPRSEEHESVGSNLGVAPNDRHLVRAAVTTEQELPPRLVNQFLCAPQRSVQTVVKQEPEPVTTKDIQQVPDPQVQTVEVPQRVVGRDSPMLSKTVVKQVTETMAQKGVEQVPDPQVHSTQTMVKQVPESMAQESVQQVPVPQFQNIEKIVEVPLAHLSRQVQGQGQTSEDCIEGVSKGGSADVHPAPPVPENMAQEAVKQVPVPQVQNIKKIAEETVPEPQTSVTAVVKQIPEIMAQKFVGQVPDPQVQKKVEEIVEVPQIQPDTAKKKRMPKKQREVAKKAGAGTAGSEDGSAALPLPGPAKLSPAPSNDRDERQAAVTQHKQAGWKNNREVKSAEDLKNDRKVGAAWSTLEVAPEELLARTMTKYGPEPVEVEVAESTSSESEDEFGPEPVEEDVPPWMVEFQRSLLTMPPEQAAWAIKHAMAFATRCASSPASTSSAGE